MRKNTMPRFSRKNGGGAKHRRTAHYAQNIPANFGIVLKYAIAAGP